MTNWDEQHRARRDEIDDTQAEKVPEQIDAEFHAQDGWYFQRLAGGSVRVRFVNAFGIEAARTDLAPETWASVAASVSHGAEERGRFYLARQFHMGGEIGCQCHIDTLHRLDCVLGIDPAPKAAQ